MNAALPAPRRITGEYGVAGDVEIRPADLYRSTGYRQPGLVLVGDAFAHHLPGHRHRHRQGVHRRRPALQRPYPGWLATEGMSETRSPSFYDDPVKQACDAWSMAKAFSFRKVTLDRGMYWRAQRRASFLAWFGEGDLRRTRKRRQRGITPPALTPRSSSSSSSSSSLSSSA